MRIDKFRGKDVKYLSPVELELALLRTAIEEAGFTVDDRNPLTAIKLRKGTVVHMAVLSQSETEIGTWTRE